MKKKPFNFETHHPITGFKIYKSWDEEYYMKTKPTGEEKEIKKPAIEK